uniref:Uncharacterized protein n=1 Tax=Sphaerodactylus townsendi TaxID=933632 RepID=A0ACB8EIJ0_9SAUR
MLLVQPTVDGSEAAVHESRCATPFRSLASQQRARIGMQGEVQGKGFCSLPWTPENSDIEGWRKCQFGTFNGCLAHSSNDPACWREGVLPFPSMFLQQLNPPLKLHFEACIWVDLQCCWLGCGAAPCPAGHCITYLAKILAGLN